MKTLSKIFIIIAAVLFGVFLIFQPIYNADAALVNCGRLPGPGVPPEETRMCTVCDTLVLASTIINFVLFTLVPAIAVLFYLIAGFLILLGGANPGWVATGRTIFKNTTWGLIIIFTSWMITNSVLKSIAGNSPFTKDWNKVVCTQTTTQPPLVQKYACGSQGCVANATGQYTEPTCNGACALAAGNCNQNFGLVPSQGCASLSSCVDASSYTPTRGCESNGGICLLSTSAATRVQSFISSFNNLAVGTGCTLKLSSTIQVSGGPSASSCHKPNNANSGTCADFNLLPNHDACYQKFYQAAKESGVVVSFLDEYVPACRPGTATGGNIHVNF